MSIKDKLSEAYAPVVPSFIAQILKVATDPTIISFAGGLPNPMSFPVEDFKVSLNRIVDEYGPALFQYGNTAGLKAFREYLADKHSKETGIPFTYENVLIVTGSQQALDLIPRIFINKGDTIIVERPSYLGAFQAFDQYQPSYLTVDLNEDGLDLEQLEQVLSTSNAKFMYLIPSFQNPTGLTYSDENRVKVREILSRYDVFLVEDDPYGDLRYEGKKPENIGLGHLKNSCVLGTFSKVATPGARVGYVISEDKEFIHYLTMAKEASDLHSNILVQAMLLDYLKNNDQPAHVQKITELYKTQAHAMMDAMDEFFPDGVTFTHPQGGMFIWVTLPEGVSSIKLIDRALARKVMFVPGDPFYLGEHDTNKMRMNFTNADIPTIREGIKRLGEAIREEMAACGLE
ncbi:MAG: PLP-dependent aminotransferase family protein [Mogibacterium sp.]|nr:PLP-dependent aminotransferase family protein [Mogibacterium sp.]